MNKILFIVEGQNDEVNYINRLFQVTNRSQKYTIIPYKTNLHTLARYIFDGEEIDDTLDIRQVLKEHEKDPEAKKELSVDFSDIILVFDFEPHHDHPCFDLIRKMITYFDNSTGNGKLYINYPMMQSYRHFAKLPDDSFRELAVTKMEASKYKELVDSVSKFKNITHHSYPLFVSLAYHHLKKLNYILNGRYLLPEIAFVNQWRQEKLFDNQIDHMNENNKVYVINTFSLFVIEYNPTDFYNQIKKHPTKFSI